MTVKKKNLGNADSVNSMLRTNSVMVEIGGSVRRITLEDFMKSIETGSLNLEQYAWGVPIKQETQTSPVWGTVGNSDMWKQFKEELGRNLLTADGRMAKLSKVDSTLFADGTTVDESKGQIMFHGPRLYFLVKNDAVTGIPYLWGSSLPIGGHYIEAPYIGAYMGNVLNGKLISRSGYVPTGSVTINDFWTYARANGTDFGLMRYEHILYLMMLHLFEFGSPNAQSNIGNGICGSSGMDLWGTASQLLTGATKVLGDACGKISISVVNGSNTGVDCSRVSLFGVEDAWGWFWQMIMGIYFGSNANSGQTGNEVYIYEGNRMPTTAELATHPSGNYRQTTRVMSDGYVKTMALGEFFDMIAKEVGGDSASNWTDYFWQALTGQLLLWGGNAFDGALCGLGCVDSNSVFGVRSGHCGARLAYYGIPKIVNGADI